MAFTGPFITPPPPLTSLAPFSIPDIVPDPQGTTSRSTKVDPPTLTTTATSTRSTQSSTSPIIFNPATRTSSFPVSPLTTPSRPNTSISVPVVTISVESGGVNSTILIPVVAAIGGFVVLIGSISVVVKRRRRQKRARQAREAEIIRAPTSEPKEEDTEDDAGNRIHTSAYHPAQAGRKGIMATRAGSKMARVLSQLKQVGGVRVPQPARPADVQTTRSGSHSMAHPTAISGPTSNIAYASPTPQSNNVADNELVALRERVSRLETALGSQGSPDTPNQGHDLAGTPGGAIHGQGGVRNVQEDRIESGYNLGENIRSGVVSEEPPPTYASHLDLEPSVGFRG